MHTKIGILKTRKLQQIQHIYMLIFVIVCAFRVRKRSLRLRQTRSKKTQINSHHSEFKPISFLGDEKKTKSTPNR